MTPWVKPKQLVLLFCCREHLLRLSSSECPSLFNLKLCTETHSPATCTSRISGAVCTAHCLQLQKYESIIAKINSQDVSQTKRDWGREGKRVGDRSYLLIHLNNCIIWSLFLPVSAGIVSCMPYSPARKGRSTIFKENSAYFCAVVFVQDGNDAKATNYISDLNWCISDGRELGPEKFQIPMYWAGAVEIDAIVDSLDCHCLRLIINNELDFRLTRHLP